MSRGADDLQSLREAAELEKEGVAHSVGGGTRGSGANSQLFVAWGGPASDRTSWLMEPKPLP